jgi:hypothetical protein
MPQIAMTLQAMTEFEVILGAGTDDYARHIASCRFVPDGGTESRWKGGTPSAKVAHRSLSDWTCEMRVSQDFSATGLARYLLTNEGNSVLCKFKPIAGGPTFTATLVLSCPEIGGTIDAFAEATVTHTVVGKPTVTP